MRSFYRWLANKYPKVVSKSSSGMEFDNLYIDMSEIIHHCVHPEDHLFPPTTFDEVFNTMYEYIDRLFDIVRPRKLLYMAIDGVAPRAKMNQQRGRLFRCAKETQMAEELEEKLIRQFEKEGRALLPKEESQVSDSSVVNPGTEFMHILSEKLSSYISRQMEENPDWRNIKVILSDANVPGEGEHKIMSFIRAQRSLSEYDPNTKHCVCGMDTDLIMLALATHEIHISILREEVLSLKDLLNHATVLESSTIGAEPPWQKPSLKMCKETHRSVDKKPTYLFLNIWILREYLALDMKFSSAEEIEFDLERIIDDFIFICFFAENDFLPRMPNLDIHEDCIDLLMHVYKKEFQNFGGYLVDMNKVEDKQCSYIKLERVEKYILAVGAYEEMIFNTRSHVRERQLSRILSVCGAAKDYEKNQLDDRKSTDIMDSYAADDVHEVLNNTKELKKKLNAHIRYQNDFLKNGGLETDKVKFGTPGWKERYYTEKFSAQSQEEIEAARKNVVSKYGEGLCWVLLYYFSGVPSWTWFYPYHYGPVTSDMNGLSLTKVKFQKGLPFKPFDQLMGMLPPTSANVLPVAYKGLMINKNSNVIDFYPTEFEIDTDRKRFLWQGICKVPFIDEERLLMETRKLENELKDDERVRNSETLDRLFVRRRSKESRQIVLPCRSQAGSKKIKGAMTMESTIEGLKGTVYVMPEDLIEADKTNRNVLCMFYEIHQGLPNITRLLEGVKVPEKTIDEEDIEETILWHESHGYNSSSNGNRLFQNRRSTNTAPAVIYKFAGFGFSSGRGKTSASPAVIRENTGPSLYYQTSKDHQPSVNKSDQYDDWRSSKAGYSRWDEYGGNEGVRKSCSNKLEQNFSNFWPSRRDGIDSSEDWRTKKN